MADGWAQYGVSRGGFAGAPAVSAAPEARPQVATVEAKLVGGKMTARLAGPSAGSAWLVRRITVSTPGFSVAVRAYVYVGEPVPEALVMGTTTGTLDTALEDPPLFVPDNTPVTVQWDSGPGRALARIEYVEI